MKKLWQSIGPVGKTVAWCALAEMVILLLFTLLTRSLLASLVFSIGLLGPVSIWIGPAILSHYRDAEKSSNQPFQPTASGRG